MRTFMAGILFMAFLGAALYSVMVFAEIPLLDLNVPQVTGAAPPSQSVARYEPSSPAIVAEMLTMAQVTNNDVVYDLGCGDGRIVIAAARVAGARGIGVDLDEELIRKSKGNAEKAAVADRVQFLREDLRTTDIREATVVTLYLSPDANLMLRPRLLTELKPGTRVVSHSHDMGEWKPDSEALVEGHRIYGWTVPADVSGKWRFMLDDKAGEVSELQVNQIFQNIDVKLQSGGREILADQARINGRMIGFTLRSGTEAVVAPVEMSGFVDQDRMSGRFRSPGRAGTWTAARMK